MSTTEILLIIVLILILILTIGNILFLLDKKFDILNKYWFNRHSIDTSKIYGERKHSAQIIEEAVKEMSQNKIGALITLERNILMGNYAASGVKLNADLNKYLLFAIFSCKSTPLHDGAVIIKKNKILCASAYFPMTNKKLSVDLGSRHRAALKISNVTDCLAIVISETNGTISIARNGKLIRIKNKSNLYKYIFDNLK